MIIEQHSQMLVNYLVNCSPQIKHANGIEFLLYQQKNT